MKPLIINVALTGCLFNKEDNPAIPITPKEVAEDVERCYNAGARIFHIHARDADGRPRWGQGYYKLYIEEIRKVVPSAILCVSCSGRHWSEYHKRADVLNLSGFDMASLTLGSVDFTTGTSVNELSTIRRLAYQMHMCGIKPELEVFDFGGLNIANYLIREGLIESPYYFNLFFGVAGGMAADPHLLTTMARLLPPNSIWAATGVGRHQFEVNCWAAAMGGHVRVGLEDNPKGTNRKQVARMAYFAQWMNREVATIEQVEKVLWTKD